MIPYIKITRPINCFFACLTTLVGAFYLTSSYTNSIWFAIISVTCIAAAGYTINDFYDYKIDCINRPDRVLPSGEMSLDMAKYYSLFLYILGLLFAFFTANTLCIIIAFVNSLSLFFYAKALKKKMLLGNIVIAWNACSTFLFGALLTENIQNIIPLIVISFIYTLIREWVKTLEDYEGDQKNGVRSIAVVFGKERALDMMFIPVFITIFYLTYFLLANRHIYLYVGISLHLFVSVPLCCLLYYMFKTANFARCQTYMKINMLAVVLIFIVHDVLAYRITGF